MGFSTKECAWSQTKLKILGRTLIGLQGWEFDKAKDKDYLYGSGDEPIDIQSGNKSYKGSFDVLKFELDIFNKAARDAGYEDITEVPHEAIVATCIFKISPTDSPQVVTATGIAFTDIKAAMKQGDKSMTVNLPFLAMKTVFA